MTLKERFKDLKQGDIFYYFMKPYISKSRTDYVGKKTNVYEAKFIKIDKYGMVHAKSISYNDKIKVFDDSDMVFLTENEAKIHLAELMKSLHKELEENIREEIKVLEKRLKEIT